MVKPIQSACIQRSSPRRQLQYYHALPLQIHLKAISIVDSVDSDMSMSRGEGNSAAIPEEGVTDLLRWLHSCNLDLFNQPQVP